MPAMSYPVEQTRQAVCRLISDAAARAARRGQLPPLALPGGAVQIPRERAHGDFAATHALAGAARFRLPPHALAEVLAENLVLDGSFFSRAEAAGTGFLNFFVSDAWYAMVLCAAAQENYFLPGGKLPARLARRADAGLSGAAEAARNQRADRTNPAYFLQYTHARLTVLLARERAAGRTLPQPEEIDPALLAGREERALIRQLAVLPETLACAVRSGDIHRVEDCVNAFAVHFYAFYTACGLRGSPDLRAARACLADCSRRAVEALACAAGVRLRENETTENTAGL